MSIHSDTFIDYREEEKESANALCELIHKRRHSARQAYNTMNGYTKGDLLFNEADEKKKVTLLYPFLSFMKAKHGLMMMFSSVVDVNKLGENEALIMGVKVIGCHIAKPVFVIELDDGAYG